MKVAIDFGTYNSAVYYKNSSGKLVPVTPGVQSKEVVIPTFIEFNADGKVLLYGQRARNNLRCNPSKIVWGMKRLFGKKWQLAYEQGQLDRFTYPIEKDNNGDIIVPVGPKTYTIEQVVREYLRCLYNDLNTPSEDLPDELSVEGVDEAVITHPAYFDSTQKKDLKNAALSVGFKKVEWISEPEAATLMYKEHIDFTKAPVVTTIDWGAGTLDVVTSVFTLSPEGVPTITSDKHPEGDNHLGGMDIDDLLYDEIVKVGGLKDLNVKERALLRDKIEAKKICLSKHEYTPLYFGDQSFEMIRNRGALKRIPDFKNKKIIILEDILRTKKKDWGACEESILDRFRGVVLRQIEGAGYTPEDIDYLIPVGGPMMTPCVISFLAEIFGKNKKVVHQLREIEKSGFKVNPLQAVALGAASKQANDIPIKMISRSYGYCTPQTETMNHMGDIFVMAGTSVGKVVRSEEPIVTLNTGHPIQVALVYREKTKDGEAYYRSAYYDYHPLKEFHGEPLVGVHVEGVVDDDGIVSLNLYDINIMKGVPSATFHFSKKEEKIESLLDIGEVNENARENYENDLQKNMEREKQNNPHLSDQEARDNVSNKYVQRRKVYIESHSKRTSYSDLEKVCNMAYGYIQKYNGERFKDSHTYMAYEKLRKAVSETENVRDEESFQENYYVCINVRNKLEEFKNCLEQLEGVTL